MAALRCFDSVQMQLPWRELGGVQPGMGAGCEGGRCGFLLPALRISTKDTKGHEGKRRRRPQGDDRKSGPRTAAGAGCEGGRCGFLLPASRISTKDTKGHEGKRRRRSQGDDRKSGPRTAASADCEQGRSSLQPARCAPSFVQFTVSEPGLEEIMAAFRRFDSVQMQLPWRWGRVQPGMGAGCEGGRCGFLLPALRISTKDTKGHEGKRRRRSQGDDRKSGPRTAGGADWEQGRSSLQPVCCAPSLVQFTVSEPDLKEIMAAFRGFDPVQMQLPWRRGGCSPEWGRGVKGGDRAIRTGNRRGIGRSRIRIDDAGAGNARTR